MVRLQSPVVAPAHLERPGEDAANEGKSLQKPPRRSFSARRTLFRYRVERQHVDRSAKSASEARSGAPVTAIGRVTIIRFCSSSVNNVRFCSPAPASPEHCFGSNLWLYALSHLGTLKTAAFGTGRRTMTFCFSASISQKIYICPDVPRAGMWDAGQKRGRPLRFRKDTRIRCCERLSSFSKGRPPPPSV